MKKKTLCGILSAVMLFSLCPATAMAKEEPLQTIKESIDLRNEENNLNGDGWKWDGDTLTLNNFRARVPEGCLEDEAMFFLPDESYVEIKGEDNLIESLAYGCDVFHCEGEITFEGRGYLEIVVESSSASAIYSKGGPVEISEKVEIFVESDGYAIYVKDAKGNDPIISVKDTALFSFPDDVDSGILTITKKYGTTSSTSKWLDYKQAHNKWKETICLISKKAELVDSSQKENEKTEAPSAPEKDIYQITIGSPAIVKNGEVSYTADVSPYLSHGYTMLPLRALLNVTGEDINVAWDKVTKTVSVSQNTDSQYTKTAYIVMGEKEFISAEENIKMSTPAELNGGRAFVSLRDWMNILTALDMPASDLNWDAKTKTVTLKY